MTRRKPTGFSAGAFWAGFSSGPRVYIADEAPVVAGLSTSTVHAFEATQALCAAARELKAVPVARFDALPCTGPCHGTGERRVREQLSGGLSQVCSEQCDECRGAGAVVLEQHGSYALADGRTQQKGEPLPALHQLPERLLDWARTLAAHLQQDGARNRFPDAASMRDDLVLLAFAVEHECDQVGEAGAARELESDKRDDEGRALGEYVRTLEDERDEAVTAASVNAQTVRAQAAEIKRLQGELARAMRKGAA